MADESTPTAEASAPAVVDEVSPPENDAEGGAADVDANGKESSSNNNKGKKRYEKKEQVPIEELYDLSKPIKRVSSRCFLKTGT